MNALVMAADIAPAEADAVLFLLHRRGLTVTEVARRMALTPASVNEIMVNARKTKSSGPRRTAKILFKGEMVELVDREPCFRCGVRKDGHDAGGCKRYIG